MPSSIGRGGHIPPGLLRSSGVIACTVNYLAASNRGSKILYFVIAHSMRNPENTTKFTEAALLSPRSRSPLDSVLHGNNVAGVPKTASNAAASIQVPSP